MLPLVATQLPLIAEPETAVSIVSVAGPEVQCSLSEVLAALIGSSEAFTPAQLRVCRAFFDRLNLIRSPLTRSHQWSR